MLTWRNEMWTVKSLVPRERNPAKISDHDREHLRKSLSKFGLPAPLIVQPDGTLIDGHQRRSVLAMVQEFGPDAEVPVRVPSRPLTPEEVDELVIRLRRNAGEWDWQIISEDFDKKTLKEWGFVDNDFPAIMDDVDFSDLDRQLDELQNYAEIDIKITVPVMHKDAVIEWLSNGERKTAPGMGKGVMRRCGLL